jgi:hypothetical protein
MLRLAKKEADESPEVCQAVEAIGQHEEGKRVAVMWQRVTVK